ncbi:MAG: ClpXP protease specificity-enhancing factor SspB [Polyangiaceae bacterium]
MCEPHVDSWQAPLVVVPPLPLVLPPVAAAPPLVLAAPPVAFAPPREVEPPLAFAPPVAFVVAPPAAFVAPPLALVAPPFAAPPFAAPPFAAPPFAMTPPPAPAPPPPLTVPPSPWPPLPPGGELTEPEQPKSEIAADNASLLAPIRKSLICAFMLSDSSRALSSLRNCAPPPFRRRLHRSSYQPRQAQFRPRAAGRKRRKRANSGAWSPRGVWPSGPGGAIERVMAAPPGLPPKKDVANALLEQSTLFIHLDPRSEQVKVPLWFKKQPQLVLQVGHNMAVRIPDLDVGDEALSCTLSFNRSPHFCWIPWAAVFALVGENGRGMVWPDDVPKEVAAQAAQQQRKEAAPKLHAVPSEKAREPEPAAADAATADAPAEDAKPKKKRKPKAKKAEGEKEAKAKPGRAATRPEPARPRPEPAVASAGQQESPPASESPKSRRELPPYLRVIK